MKRRSFLQMGLGVAAAPILLNGIPVSAFASDKLETIGLLAKENDKVLVLIQLNGGNDGLNTVLPLDRYDILSAARNSILIPENKALKLNENTGLHPIMTGLDNLYKDTKLGILNAVGYPNPNYSHFRSTDIWTSASDSTQYITSGWLGRYLNEYHPEYPNDYPNSEFPDPLSITVGSVVSETCQGPITRMGLAIPPTATFYDVSSIGSDNPPDTLAGAELEYIRMVIAQTQVYTNTLEQAALKGVNLSTKYPDYGKNKLADQLKIVAKLISGGLKTKVYVVTLGGFDTHSAQVDASDKTIGNHANLLKQVSDAIEMFQDDLRLQKLEDRVVGMTFSEFGRRIISNASMGTDHGSAAPMFVFGSKVNPIIHGTSPVLPSQPKANDNIPMQFDFRSIYYSILMDWFEVPEANLTNIMLKKFDYVEVIKKSSTSVSWTNDLSGVIYPNPARDYIEINFERWSPPSRWTPSGSDEIKIYNSLAELVLTVETKNFSSLQRIDISHLPVGIYFIQIGNYTEKFVVAR